MASFPLPLSASVTRHSNERHGRRRRWLYGSISRVMGRTRRIDCLSLTSHHSDSWLLSTATYFEAAIQWTWKLYKQECIYWQQSSMTSLI